MTSKQSMENSKSAEDALADIVLDWRALKSRRQKRRKFKDYQEQLLKEIPGAANRTNVAMHAVIDVTSATAGEHQTRGMGATSEIRNQALIHYIARLASSNNDEDEFDFSFVQSLLENGADINTADKYGQTMFHEVARSWNVDVARFLLNRGANINQQDTYGRAPLHVAAAVDYTEMIEFLLHHKADIDITTFGELQTPIHFAAKNDACQALRLLINYGASVNCRDYQNRTPIQVAASMSRTKAARYLVELGTPTGVYDLNGEMTLSLLILKMPEVATIALDQFRSQDMINRKEYNFLNYIEGPRIFQDDPRANKARSPLEVAIQYEQYSIVMHPVMKRLINVKWQCFGKKGARDDVIVNVIFALVWTVLGITMPLNASKLYWPLKYTWWRLLVAVAGVFLTAFELYKQVSSFINMNRAIRRWKTFREKTLENDKRFCHPKWRDENEYLDKEIKDARDERFFTRQDGWIFLDWIALLLIIAGTASHISFLVIGSRLSRNVHVRIVAFVLIILYVRLLKYARPFEGPGPFVASIAPMLRDFLKWSVLFFLLFIPYASIFWMIFGPTSENTAPFLSDIPGLIFTVFSMAALSNIANVHELESKDKHMARLLVATFVAVSTIVTLNLLIAMLADTFTRMYENSLETATMQRAKTILYLEQKLSSKTWKSYCDHIQTECSPEVGCISEDMDLGRRHKKRNKERLLRNVEEIHTVITERFGPKVGTKNSDMDELLARVNKVNESLSCFMLQQNTESKHASSTSTRSGSMNLNIILNQTDNSNTLVNGLPLENEELIRRRIRDKFDVQKEQDSKSTDVSKASVNSSTSCRSSCDGNEREPTNQNLQKQLDVILSLMKDAINNGKLHFTVNGKVLVTGNTESAEHLVEAEAESNGVQMSSDHSEHGAVQTSSSSGIMNPACSPPNDDARNSSLDMYTSDEATVQSPVPYNNDDEGLENQCISVDRLGARYEGSSFLSSSSEGNTTCDETTAFPYMNSSQTNIFVNNSVSPNQITRRTHRRILPPKPQFSRPDGGSSESEMSSSEVKMKKVEAMQANRSFICEDDFSNSSLGTDLTDQSCEEANRSPLICDDDFSYSGEGTDFTDSHCSVVGHSTEASGNYTSTVTEPSFSPRPDREGPVRSDDYVFKVPHVRWADTASSSTPFLNIREISASPSDCCSGETRMESDTASGDEGHSEIERNIRKQTDV